MVFLLSIDPVHAQTATPQTPSPTSPPFWQKPWAEQPVWIYLLTLVLGVLLHPLFENIAGSFSTWFRSLEKTGKFQRAYLTELIAKYRYLGLLPSNMVAALWTKRRRFVELESLIIPLSLSGPREAEHELEQRNRLAHKNIKFPVERLPGIRVFYKSPTKFGTASPAGA